MQTSKSENGAEHALCCYLYKNLDITFTDVNSNGLYIVYPKYIKAKRKGILTKILSYFTTLFVLLINSLYILFGKIPMTIPGESIDIYSSAGAVIETNGLDVGKKLRFASEINNMFGPYREYSKLTITTNKLADIETLEEVTENIKLLQKVIICSGVVLILCITFIIHKL